MVAPLIGAALIGAGSSIFSGITGGKGASKAAKAAAASADKDRAAAQAIYNNNLALAQPGVDRGNAAGAQINALLGLGGNPQAAQDALATFQNATGYQNRLAEGQRSINTGYAARGVLESGAAQKALMQYGQNFASNELGTYINALAGQQAAGMGALGSVTGSGNAYLGATMQANATQAGAQGNAALYGALAQQNAINGVANAFGTYLGQKSYRTPMVGQAPNALAGYGHELTHNPWGR